MQEWSIVPTPNWSHTQRVDDFQFASVRTKKSKQIKPVLSVSGSSNYALEQLLQLNDDSQLFLS